MARAIHRGRQDGRDAPAQDREVGGRAAGGPDPLTPAEELLLLGQHAGVLFRMDDGERLTALNEPDGGPAPRLFLARSRTAHGIWFGAGVPAATIEACRVAARALPRWDGERPGASLHEPLRRLLSNDRTGSESVGPAFRFGKRVDTTKGDAQVLLIDGASAHLLERHFPYTLSHLAWRSPVLGAVVDGAVVAACYSARKRSSAAEAGVDTVEHYRGRGLAPVVVSAWRDAVDAAGAMPLYSTSWNNAASLAVARKLSLVAYADTYSVG